MDEIQENAHKRTRKLTENQEVAADADADETAPNLLAFSDDDVADFDIDESVVASLMKSLESEILSSPSPSFSSVSDLRDSKGSTFGGKTEESCGSSFSDVASTVMASVDMKRNGCWPSDRAAAWPWAVGTTTTSEVGSSGGSDVEVEGDEEWLARVLDGPEFDFEECFGLEEGEI